MHPPPPFFCTGHRSEEDVRDTLCANYDDDHHHHRHRHHRHYICKITHSAYICVKTRGCTNYYIFEYTVYVNSYFTAFHPNCEERERERYKLREVLLHAYLLAQREIHTYTVSDLQTCSRLSMWRWWSCF